MQTIERDAVRSEAMRKQLLTTYDGRDVLSLLELCRVALSQLEPGGVVSVVYDPPMPSGVEVRDQRLLLRYHLPVEAQIIHLVEGEKEAV